MRSHLMTPAAAASLTLLDLPSEMLVHIARFLQYPQLLGATCRQLRELVANFNIRSPEPMFAESVASLALADFYHPPHSVGRAVAAALHGGSPVRITRLTTILLQLLYMALKHKPPQELVGDVASCWLVIVPCYELGWVVRDKWGTVPPLPLHEAIGDLTALTELDLGGMSAQTDDGDGPAFGELPSPSAI